MKSKTITLLLAVILLGFSVAMWVVIPPSGELPNNILSLDDVWTFDADDRILVTPVLIDNQIIFRTAKKVYSISVVDGSISWEIDSRVSETIFRANLLEKPIVANSKFLLSEEQDNSVGIYSTKTGEKQWTVEGQRYFINALELVDDVMIIARHDGDLVVYDLASQQELWDVPLPPRAPTPVAANTEFVISGAWDTLRIYGLKDGILLNEKAYDTSSVWEIALSGSNIFVNYTKDGGDESISSLQIDSLDENWTFHIGKTGDPHLAITDSYLGVFNEMLLVLDKNNGKVLWKGGPQKYYSTPAFYENSSYFISTSTQGMFSKEKKICKVAIGKDMMQNCSVIDNSGYLLGPLVTDGLLIVPQGSKIVAFAMP